MRTENDFCDLLRVSCEFDSRRGCQKVLNSQEFGTFFEIQLQVKKYQLLIYCPFCNFNNKLFYFANTYFWVIGMLKVIIRTIIMYVFVSIGIRLMGKRQIGDMQPSELVITLLISEITAIPLQDISQPISVGLVAIFMLVFLEILASVMAMKSLRFRRILSGKSVVIIKNGSLDQRAMKSVRMTVFDLIEMLRMQGIFDLNEVETAVLEINGNLSVQQKAKDMPVTASQMNVKTKENGLPVAVISDGIIMDSALEFLNKTRADLNKILEKNKIEPQEIFVMTLDNLGSKLIIKKENNL